MISQRRILHINKFIYRRGGAESYLLDVSELQRRRGDDVAFFGMNHGENESTRFDPFFGPELSLNPKPAGRLEQVSVAVNMVWNRRSAEGLARVIDVFEPDVAHLHNVYHQLSPSVVHTLSKATVPTVMTLHDYKLACPTYNSLRDGVPCFDCSGGRAYNAIRHRCGGSLGESVLLAAESTVHRLTRAYRGVDVFHCPSRFLMERMREGGVFADRLRHVPLPAEAQAVPTRPEGDHGLYVGRLAAEKGPELAIRALARNPLGSLVVVGDGPQRAELEELAEAIVPGRVRFTGRVPRASVQRHLAAARFVVVPSICSENQPLSVLEAHGAGRAVIGSRYGGIAELVRHDDTGLLFSRGDITELGAAMGRLFADPDLAAVLGANGWRRVRREASADTHLDRLDELYDLAAARRESRRRPRSNIERRFADVD